MEGSGSVPVVISELDKFRKALAEEYERRSAEIKTESEKFISEKMFHARRQAERRAHALREKHKVEFKVLVEREKRRVLLKVRADALLEMADIFDHISREIEGTLIMLRNDRERYSGILRKLVIEGLDRLGGSAIVTVYPGDASYVPSDTRIENIEEQREGLESGGCIIVDAKTRTAVIDNRIMTRWLRFRKEYIKSFSESYIDVLQGFDRFSRELRIS